MEKNLVDAVKTVGRLIQNLKKNTDKRRKRKLNDSPWLRVDKSIENERLMY